MSAMSVEPFAAETVGQQYVGEPFEVTGEAIQAYAAATNDETPAAVAGEAASPVFSFVPFRPVLRSMLIATTPLYEQLKGVHGEQDMFFTSPLLRGMTVTPHGSVIGIRRRRTGTAAILHLRALDERGGPVYEHFT